MIDIDGMTVGVAWRKIYRQYVKVTLRVLINRYSMLVLKDLE